MQKKYRRWQCITHGGIKERPRGVNFIKTGGGRTLCTLHPVERTVRLGSLQGYMRDS